MAQSNDEFWAAVRKSAERVRGLPTWTQGGIVLSDNFEGGKSREASVATVSDELVERVARDLYTARYRKSLEWENEPDEWRDMFRSQARAAIAALSTPEFVLPAAEEMLRAAKARWVHLHPSSIIVEHVRQPLPGGQQTGPGMRCADGDTLLDAYREAKGE